MLKRMEIPINKAFQRFESVIGYLSGIDSAFNRLKKKG
jgi:hypothetical protein